MKNLVRHSLSKDERLAFETKVQSSTSVTSILHWYFPWIHSIMILKCPLISVSVFLKVFLYFYNYICQYNYKSTNQRSHRFTFSISRQGREFLLFNIAHREFFFFNQDKIEIYYLHSQASKQEREFFWSDLSFWDKNESSKLLTFLHYFACKSWEANHITRPSVKEVSP